MNYGSFIFLGVLITMLTSWYGFVLTPFKQLGRQQPAAIEDAPGIYPTPRPGLAQQGLQVYRANGCYYCHTQQVRPAERGGDIARGWGLRRTVGPDFLHDSPVMPGEVRVGPDLANIGLRMPDAQWHYLHLYAPKQVVPGSVMPPYRYLFEERKIQGQRSADALLMPPEFAVKDGYEIVPTPDARALVAYLSSLRADAPVYEAPVPAPMAEEQPAAAPAEPIDYE